MGRIFSFDNVRIGVAASVVGSEEQSGPLGKKFDFCDPENTFGETPYFALISQVFFRYSSS